VLYGGPYPTAGECFRVVRAVQQRSLDAAAFKRLQSVAGHYFAIESCDGRQLATSRAFRRTKDCAAQLALARATIPTAAVLVRAARPLAKSRTNDVACAP
jgi:hypothetical protein